MVEPPTLSDRKLVRRFPESPDLLLRYEPPTEKFAIQYANAHQARDSSVKLVPSTLS